MFKDFYWTGNKLFKLCKNVSKGLSYNNWAIIFTVFSFGVSNIGLSNIIGNTLPVLMFLYPLAITLILLALTGDLFNHDKVVYQSVIAFTLIAVIFDLIKHYLLVYKMFYKRDILLQFC